MAVNCGNCGEELMGAVNRCWRCGHALQSHAGPADVPPVRRPPLASQLAVSVDALLVEPSDAGTGAAPIRRGSPFAPWAQPTFSASNAAATPLSGTTPKSVASQQLALRLACSVAVLMGGIAIVLSFLFPLSAMAIGLAGVVFAIWGVNVHHRRLAIAALVFCCLALALSVFWGAIELYESLSSAAPGGLIGRDGAG